ncbi:S phase cyclin A-associated protein in the endoplasmic reticulum-like [Haliotis rufescens]|uniref:S phase cyclin A-associated protein in the endoplasmic reticulum-like n=1 Tax=Haliotis rufescens TaxID=6454 RepID=UPI00201F5E7F|nr:S phase cyclin A-associated protein in the endoplasmic reticulum-like [Haliotis rufescens]
MSDSRRKRHGPGPKSRSDNGESSYRSLANGGNSQRGKGSHSSSHYQRMNSFDRVRKIVQEEGRTARNLVQYNLPLETHHERTGRPTTRQIRKPGTRRERPASLSSFPGLSGKISPLDPSMAKSPKSDLGGKRVDLRARYWKFLFDNLQRAVDAIYDTCEHDESVLECKEVIMMLEQSTKDFKSLIERMNLLKAYEDAARGGDRPTSIAWEVRKMSPGKNTGGHGSSVQGRCSPSPAQRSLNFSSPPQGQGFNSSKNENSKPVSTGNSWADKVRGVPARPAAPTNISQYKHVPTRRREPSLTEDSVSPADEDSDGWETVQRGGKLKSRQSPSQKSLENLASKSKDKKKLQRSKSVPDSTKNVSKEKSPATDNGANRTSSDSYLDNSNPRRERAGSKDSEKENIPQMNPNVLQQQTLMQERRLELERHENAQRMIDKFVDTLSKAPDDSFSSDDERERDEVEALAEQLDNALASALDEDDTQSSQLEREQNRAIESAIKEEESYLQALAKEESTEIEVETETESDLGNTTCSFDNSAQNLDWDAMVAAYDEQESSGRKSWGEMAEEADARTPGHGAHMHEKLSSPSRKRSPTESRRRHEEKQAKAQELREKLMQEKADRLRDLSKKVEEVRAWKEELMRQRRVTITRKLQRAEVKRQSQLKIKAKKAHEEEAKANEIAFINTLEAQNKRHDIMSKHQESEARLQDLIEERQRKVEEKQAKEAAVEERRRALEAERKARLLDMQERRKQRDARIEQQQLVREKERLEAVRAKEKDREERLAALNAQQQQHIQELQKKIQQKQDESSQRHEEILKQIREKAFVMSVLRHSTEDHNDAPQLTPYDRQKLCSICNYLIPSEVYLLSHLRGKKHQQALHDNNSGIAMSKQEIETFNLKHIVDAPDNSNHPKIVTEKERQKSLRKRCKKLRQRMTSRGLEYEGTLANKQQTADSEHKAKLQKVIKDLNKYLMTQDRGPWPTSRVSATDRAVGELTRILERKSVLDQVSYRVLGGLTTLSRLLQTIDDSTVSLPPVIPQKSLCQTCDAYRLACKGCFENCHYMLFSNKLGVLADHLIHQLSLLLPEDCPTPSGTVEQKLPYDPLAASLMQVVASVLSCLAKNNPTLHSSEASLERMSSSGDAFANRGNDIISYIISVGVIDKLQHYFSNVRGPIDGDKNAADFLQHSLGLLVAMTKFMSKRNSSLFEKKKGEDMSQLISTFEVTELVGIVSLLYGMLLHSGAPSRGDTPPPELPQHTLLVTLTGLRMLNHMAALDLDMLQKTLGEEGMSLEFRHIASYLIWYCSHHTQSEELMHEVILCVGYFTVLNTDNQMFVQSGQPPTVLQQLCALPFQYFSDPRLTNVLFPTLISCCFNSQSNRHILEQELSCALLANFIEEKQLEAQQAKLMPSTTKKARSQDKEYRDTESRMTLASRFPPEQWTVAQEYFKVE